MQTILDVVAWLLAALWVWRAVDILVHLGQVPALPANDEALAGMPTLAVIVPARNEGENIRATLASLVASDYPKLQVLAVDDRSSDATGQIMDWFAATDSRVQSIHIKALPEGWMGKQHAMHRAAQSADAEWLLFTDGDIVFAPYALRSAVTCAERSHADHFVVIPTLVMKTMGERSMIGFMQVLAGLRARLWRVADPKAKRDFVGVGAFNMIRRDVYERLGGFGAIPMEVVEDMRQAQRVKDAGFAQRVAIASGMVEVHWAAGGIGIARNLTKNLFAAFGFRWWMAGIACLWLLVVYCGAFIGLAAGALRWHFLLAPCALIVLSMFAVASKYRRINGISVGYVLTYPIAATVLAAALLSSVVLTSVRGGVLWRGTLYPLRELKKHASPLF